MNKLKLEALITSLLIYLIIIATIMAITLYSPEKHKAKHYVMKNANVIEVSLGSPNQEKSLHNAKKSQKKSSQKKKKEPKKEKKVAKKHPKKVRNYKKEPKKSKKQAIKRSSRVTKKVKHKQKATKKVNTRKLFKNLPSSVTKSSKTTVAKSGKSGQSLRKVNKDRGIVNRYFANVQNKLKGWPAQSNFAGERVSVELTVYSTGLFDYKILRRSMNPEFNRSLTSYLEQLKRIGFGPHSNPKPYKIVVDFIAR